MDALNSDLDCNETINQFVVESTQFWSGNECERDHTLTTTTTGSKNSQKGVYSNALGPPKVSPLQA